MFASTSAGTGTMALWRQAASCPSTAEPWHCGTIPPLYPGTIAPRRHRTKVIWHHVTMLPWFDVRGYQSALALRNDGTVAPLYDGNGIEAAWHGVGRGSYRKGFTLCRQAPTCNLRPVERIDLQILVILPQEIARDLDSGAKIWSATFWVKFVGTSMMPK